MLSDSTRMKYHRGYVSTYPMQFMPPPLYEIGSMWMPKLNHVDVYNSSGVDYCQGGWRKWNSAGHWDMHAASPAAVQPDWYSRRVSDIRGLTCLPWTGPTIATASPLSFRQPADANIQPIHAPFSPASTRSPGNRP